MGENIYIFMGWQKGRFTTEAGEKREYCNIFVCSQFSEKDNNQEHQASGYKCEKFRCSNPDLFTDVEYRDQVQLYFDSRQRVSLIQVVQKAPEASRSTSK